MTLAGRRVGITSARKVEELTTLLERRGAAVEWAPVLSLPAADEEDPALRAATERVLALPVDVLVATTGAGIRGWFRAADEWGILEDLLAQLRAAVVLARGPKAAGALRSFGLRESWSAPSERLTDVWTYLRARPLAGRHLVVQEHGESLAHATEALDGAGAAVTTVPVYRYGESPDPDAVARLVRLVADRGLDGVTFTSAASVVAFMTAAAACGLEDEVTRALRSATVAACVGPVTAEAFEPWDVPTVWPQRSRLVAMVRELEERLGR